MARKKQVWNVGDVFVVRILDATYVVGQIVGREPQALNSVTVAFFDQRCDRPEAAMTCDLSEPTVFSILFSTRDGVDSGAWLIVGNRPVLVPRALFPYEDKRSSGWVGAKVRGAGIITSFLNAFYALAPWDDWQDPRYLDALLLSPEKKPKKLILKSR